MPFLVRATVREDESASRLISTLYAVHVLGAAAGALLAPWVLIRLFGMEGAALWGSAANLIAAAAALAAGRRGLDRATDVAAAPPAPPAAARAGALPERAPFGLWLVLYGLSGFLALSLEVVWFRLIDVGVKSTAFTFGTVLRCTSSGSGWAASSGGDVRSGSRAPSRRSSTTSSPHYGIHILYPAVTLRTSINEFSHFIIAHMNGGVWNGARILKESTVDLMRTAHFSPEDKANYGLGWVIVNPLVGKNIYGNAGGYVGVSTLAAIIPEDNIAIVIFTNEMDSELMPTLSEMLPFLEILRMLYRKANQLSK